MMMRGLQVKSRLQKDRMIFGIAKQRKQHGFTLIELLVVIAIIAILAAVLYPVISNASRCGKQASCAANLRQLHAALVAYTDDNDGFYPPAEPSGMPDGTTYWWENKQFLNLLAGPQKKAKSVLVCPADPRPQKHSDMVEKDRWISYSANASSFGLKRFGSKRVRHTNMVKRPSSTLAFCDGIGDSSTPNIVGHQDCLAGYISYRHDDKTQAVFLDGHTESLSHSDIPLTKDAWRHPFWGNDPQYKEPCP